MEIEFRGSPSSTLGIEVETCLVDRESRALVGLGGEILAELGAPHDGGEHPKAKHELFDCTVEVITGICDTVGDARNDLSATLHELRAAADARGAGVMCAGTHPFSHWRDLAVSPKPRYQELVESIGWPARRLAIYGIHYHVGVPDGPSSIAIVDSLAYHLPLFLGLSASSPFWHGDDTGLASARTKIFEGLPTAGLPPRLADWSDFESYMASLIHAGAISSIREVWWDVRPHPDFGTVELRMCDGMTNLDDICAVGALAQSLVSHLTSRHRAGETLPRAREWVVRENKWLAARYGLDVDLLVDDDGNRRSAKVLADELVAVLEPVADRLGCADELAHVRVMMDRGSATQRLRRLREAGASNVALVDSLVSELELGVR